MGLSLVFLMISSFFTNLIFTSIGVAAPLAAIPLLIIVNLVIVLVEVAEWRTPLNIKFPESPKKIVFYGILLLLPIILALIGLFLVRIPPHSNNVVLLIMLVTISVLVGLTFLFRKIFPARNFPILLLVISISLLLQTMLFSSNLQGFDIFGENAVFRLTLSNLYWDPSMFGRLSAMLSITVLPTAYSLILNMDPVWVLKLVYPVIFAFVPLGLYQLFKSRMSVEVSFLASFFFVSNVVFFTVLAELARQIIGEVFFVLLFITLFSKNITGVRKWFLFLVFGFGLVVSHYALAYIFLGFIAITWLVSRFRKGITKVNLSMVVLLGILVFVWYIYTSQASTFNDLLSNVNYIGKGFASDFFNAQF